MIALLRTLTRLSALLMLTACSHYDTFVVSTDVIGEVTSATGFPSISRNSRQYMLARQSKVYAGDIITTDEQSTVDIKFVSGTTIQLATRSALLISSFQEGRRNNRLDANLSRGALEVSSSTTSDTLFQITTTLGMIQTRAANFWIAYQRSKSIIEIISLASDEVSVTNSNGSVILDSRYEGTRIAPGVAPTEPREVSEEKFLNQRNFHNRVSH